MAGPMVQVKTQIAANRLNIRRQLYMGLNPLLRFCKSDQTQVGGVAIIREYDTAFNRAIEAEREIGDGVTVIVDITDVFPAGQLAQDIEDAQFITLVEDGNETAPYSDIDAKLDRMTQTYRITARTEAVKQTYFRAGHRSR
jgi:hypothetical protein